MSIITAEIIKKIRKKTNAGMLDCKKALEETKGNIDKALELLAKKGADIERSPEMNARMAEEYYKSKDYINMVKKIKIPKLPLKLEEYYKSISNKEIEIEYGEFTVFPKKSINSCMEGYRYLFEKNGKWKDMSINGEWDKNWIIIAKYISDPIIVDLNHDCIPVKYAYHGAGKWEFKILFNEINNFLKFIKILIKIEKQNNSIEEYLKGSYSNFIELLTKEFVQEEINSIIDFFEFEYYKT